MGTLHDKIVIAQHRAAACMSGSVDDHIFANDVVIADNQLGFFACKLKVLRQSAEHRALMNFVFIAHFSAVEQAHEGENNTVFAYLYVVFYVHKRENLAAITYFCLGRYDSLGTYITCHNFLFIKN